MQVSLALGGSLLAAFSWLLDRNAAWLSANADKAMLRFDYPDGSLLGTRTVKSSETNHEVDTFRACFAE